MTRALTTAIKNELATNDIRPFHLLTIGFSTPVNFTDCSFPLTSSISGSSVTYTSSDFIIGVSDFTEEIDVTKSSLTISLSGADQTFISTVLNENVTNDAVTIFRGLLFDSASLSFFPCESFIFNFSQKIQNSQLVILLILDDSLHHLYP